MWFHPQKRSSTVATDELVTFNTIGSCLRLERSKSGRSTRPIGKAAFDLLNAAGLADARSHEHRGSSTHGNGPTA